MNDHGMATVLDALRAAEATSRLISEWIETPTWTQSLAYFIEHADQLKRPEVLHQLSQDDHPRSTTARSMVLGDGALDRGAACHLIPATLPGVGFVHVEGAHEPVRVRFSYLADDDITGMAERWPAPGPDGPASRVIDLSDPTISPASPYGRAEGSQP